MIDFKREQLRKDLLKEPFLFASAVVALGVGSYSIGSITGRSPCPFYNLTGLPCPGCGGTRATLDLFQGNIVEAFTLNAYGIFLIFGVAILWLTWTVRRARGIQAPILKVKKWHAIVFLTITVGWFIFRLTSMGSGFTP